MKREEALKILKMRQEKAQKILKEKPISEYKPRKKRHLTSAVIVFNRENGGIFKAQETEILLEICGVMAEVVEYDVRKSNIDEKSFMGVDIVLLPIEALRIVPDILPNPRVVICYYDKDPFWELMKDLPDDEEVYVLSTIAQIMEKYSLNRGLLRRQNLNLLLFGMDRTDKKYKELDEQINEAIKELSEKNFDNFRYYQEAAILNLKIWEDTIGKIMGYFGGIYREELEGSYRRFEDIESFKTRIYYEERALYLPLLMFWRDNCRINTDYPPGLEEYLFDEFWCKERNKHIRGKGGYQFARFCTAIHGKYGSAVYTYELEQRCYRGANILVPNVARYVVATEAKAVMYEYLKLNFDRLNLKEIILGDFTAEEISYMKKMMQIIDQPREEINKFMKDVTKLFEGNPEKFSLLENVINSN